MLPGVKLGKGMGGKGVSAEGQHRQPRAGLKASSSLYRHRPSEHTVSHDVTAGRNWAKIWISVLFLTAACESTVISKKKKKVYPNEKKAFLPRQLWKNGQWARPEPPAGVRRPFDAPLVMLSPICSPGF